MATPPTWEDTRIEARANDVLTVLHVRGIVVPAAARKRILAQKDLKQLERWLKKACVAKSIERRDGETKLGTEPMTIELDSEDIAVLLTSIEYSKREIRERPETPYEVRQSNLQRLDAIASKLRAARSTPKSPDGA